MKSPSSLRLHALCLALAGLGLSHPVFAAPATATLPDVVVTATRSDQSLTEIVADLTVISADDIARSGAQSVMQLLQEQAGLQTVRFGDASRVFIRGADSRMTALYIDGIRIDSHDGVTMLGGGAPWELVPLNQIDHIEILRGPASAVYGSDAMGGVVQLFTKKGQEGTHPFAQVAVANYGTKSARAGVSGNHEALSYALGMAYEDSLGFDSRPDLTHSPKRQPTTNKSVNVGVGYQINAAHSFDFSALNSQLDDQYVPWGGGTNYQAHSDLTAAALKWHASWSRDYHSKLIWTNSVVAKRDDAPYVFKTVKKGLAWENTFRHVAGGTVTALLEHKVDTFDMQPSPWGDPAFSGGREQDALALGYGKVMGPHVVQLNVRHDHDSLFGAHGTGAVSYGFALGAGWQATASTGTAFKAPTLEQNFGPYGSQVLQPETNRSSEIGLNYGNADSSVQLVHFRNAVSNLISSSMSLSTCSAGYFCYYNVGQASITGTTLTAKRHMAGFDFRVSLDALDPRDQTTGKQLSLRARKVLTAGLSGLTQGWKWDLSLQGVGPRFDDAANTMVLAGYGVLNLRASKPVAKDWTVFMRLDNLADRKYEQVGSYATPGRTVLLGLKWAPKN
jgi:vitamin B12 transporter